MKEKKSKLELVFEKFISDKKVVIADPNNVARAGLARTLSGLGAKVHNMTLCGSVAEAKEAIIKNKPFLTISEYQLGQYYSLELIESLREMDPGMAERLFILVTSNTSQSAVAQAAEEDVDAFILKPYTIETLRKTILQAAMDKIIPSEYTKAIRIGKDFLDKGQLEDALKKFEEAKHLDPKPSLALFYIGQAQLMIELMNEAEDSYETGLKYNKIHYKCMVGLFELLMDQKKFEESYDVASRISRYFPANPKRLASILRLAITTKSYDDIERYYQAFQGIETRDEELIKYICASLIVCGKYYLRTNNSKRALELFHNAAVTAAGRVKLLREIILALVEYNKPKEAAEYLKRIPPEEQSGVDYKALECLIEFEAGHHDLAINLGRQALKDKIYDPIIYKVLILAHSERNKSDMVEDLIVEASNKYPEQKNYFQSLIAG